MAKNLVRGAVGREWMAIRDMDVAAAVNLELAAHLRRAGGGEELVWVRGRGRRADVSMLAPQAAGHAPL